MPLIESPLDPAAATVDVVVPAGEPWLHRLARGQTLRIVDLEGNQAVDTLFYNADDPLERYSATHTIQAGGVLYLTGGSRIVSSAGRTMATITADTCGRHDTLGGACSCENNTVRYAHEKRTMHCCRDTFLLGLDRFAEGAGLGKRDIVPNINFFMNVPVTPDGQLSFADGISAPGKYVELCAEIDLLVLVSNCPQLNNPCNGWNPTPVRMLVWS